MQLETLVIPKQQTLYYVEAIPAKGCEYVSAAVLRIINRINNIHKCKAVYRLHADRARELTGEKARDTFEALGISVTSTANYDSNANGRAERAVLFFSRKGSNFAIDKDKIGYLSESAEEVMGFRSTTCGRSAYKQRSWTSAM